MRAVPVDKLETRRLVVVVTLLGVTRFGTDHFRKKAPSFGGGDAHHRGEAGQRPAGGVEKQKISILIKAEHF